MKNLILSDVVCDLLDDQLSNSLSRGVTLKHLGLTRSAAFRRMLKLVAHAHGVRPWAGRLLLALSLSAPGLTLASSLSNRVAQFAPAIERAATAYRIDPLLLHAVIHHESRYRSSAVSPAGAIGLMQVMPGTAGYLGLPQPQQRLRDATTNIYTGSRFLAQLLQRYPNNLNLVLAAYNAGEGAVEKYGRRVPPYAETQNYVRDVSRLYRALLLEAERRGLQVDEQGMDE